MPDASPQPDHSSTTVAGGQAAQSGRRRFLRSGPVLAAALATAAPAAPALAQTAAAGARWCATWGTAPAGPPPTASVQDFSGQTLRLIVRASIGGRRVRIRVSNEMGSTPLRIERASIALRTAGSAVAAASLRALRFGGRSGVTIPVGAPALSDPAELVVPAQADLAVSLYLGRGALGTTLHLNAFQTNYVLAGDCCAAIDGPRLRGLGSWPFLTEVDVDAGMGSVVVLGDSISDGQGSSSNANRRWPDYLARRLQQELHALGQVGVVNRGICGNLLLGDYPWAQLAGRDALERVDRDVLATSGVRYLVALIGINDICYSSGAATADLAEDLIAGYRQLVARARGSGVTVIGATLPPFGGYAYDTPAREAVRREVNAWIRGGGAFDAVADVERALRDPDAPTRIRPAYRGSDALHPNDAGHQAIAACIPLHPFLAGAIATAGVGDGALYPAGTQV